MRIMAPPSISTDKRFDPSILNRWISAYSNSASVGRQRDGAGPEPETTRPGSDARAAWQKWHQGLCISWFNESQIPWYLALEHARVECLAGAELPGVARNLKAMPLDGLAIAPAARPMYRSARACWGLGFDADAPGLAEKSVRGVSRNRGLFSALRHLIGLESSSGPETSRIQDTLVAAGQCLDDEKSFARAVFPLVARMSVAAGSIDPNDEAAQQDAILPDASEDDYEAEAEEDIGYGADQQPDCHSRVGHYAIFRTAWDECHPARVWHQPADAEALNALNALDRREVQKLAHELQRRLLTNRLRRWDFELEEGMLDSRKLAALVGDQPDHRVFKFEREAQIPEACVMLVVDQSGSMRGSAHRLAAQAIDVAVHTLEVCGVAVEVLGYTTRYGADNPVVDAWRTVGMPNQPGRLNALRHIVFKGARQPWRVARRYLGLLLRPDFGRENIDGESLLWAARRLLARPEQRKILIVLSDGSPYDEATVQNNEPMVLEDHLGDVVREVERSPIELIGIGTGREVSRYYRNAVAVRKEDMIGEVLFGALGNALD